MKKYMIFAASMMVAAAANAQQSVTIRSQTKAEMQTDRRQASVSGQQSAGAETAAGKGNAKVAVKGEAEGAAPAGKMLKQQTESAIIDAQQSLNTQASAIANATGNAQQSLNTQASAIAEVAGAATLEGVSAVKANSGGPVKPLRPIAVQTDVTSTLKTVVAPVRISHSLMSAAGLRVH